jgi:hypothetical protein
MRNYFLRNRGRNHRVVKLMGGAAPDVTPPAVQSFTATTPSSALAVPITAFTADADAVGFIITESSTPPAVGAAGWTASAPTTYTVAAAGSYTLYPWVKDAAGNVSSVYGSPASVNVALFDETFGTDLSAWTARLGTGQVASGQLRGATLGTDAQERVTNAEFATDTSGWSTFGNGTLTRKDFSSSPNIAPTGGTDNFGAELANGATGTAYFLRGGTTNQFPRATYKGTARCYSPSANTQVRQGTLEVTGDASSTARVVAEDAWETITVSRLSASNRNLTISGQSSAAQSGDVSYWDAFSLQAQMAILTRDHGANPDITINLTTPTNDAARGYVLRYSSATSYLLVLMISGLGSGNDLYLFQVNGAAVSILAQTRVAFTNSTAYVLRIQAYGHSYKVDVGGVNQITYVDATDFNLSSQLFGPWITDTGVNVFDEVAVYVSDPF